MRLPTEGFEPLSSDVDWCEPNYVISPYITEFWNTVSSFPLVIFPPILMYIHRDYPKNVPNCEAINLVWGLLAVVGLGSIYFHSTLSLVGQLLDELSILWVCCGFIAMWMPNAHLPSCLAQNRWIFQLIMLVLGTAATYLSIVRPEVNHVTLMVFALPAIGYLVHGYGTCPNPTLRHISKTAAALGVASLTCWALDKLLCSFWLKINFPYFHCFWHVVVLAAICNGCVSYAYCYALEQVPHKNPTLKFRGLCNNKWIGLWTIEFKKKNF
ncbi:alkaline ceramidase 2-like [Clavelina lepadiformis]|uniref:Alkaline ceramidase n=1 Tax=Clavelina lepadiformis TaxID=159417 RepID=A0ABP0H3J7_CLALP